jgi:hypothetical protein
VSKMYMAEKGHQQMKKEKEIRRNDAPGSGSATRAMRRGRRDRVRQRMVKAGRGEATGRRQHLKRGQCNTARATHGGDAARATRQRRRGESDMSTWRRQQGVTAPRGRTGSRCQGDVRVSRVQWCGVGPGVNLVLVSGVAV